jgi:hypothetical protein
MKNVIVALLFSVSLTSCCVNCENSEGTKTDSITGVAADSTSGPKIDTVKADSTKRD